MFWGLFFIGTQCIVDLRVPGSDHLANSTNVLGSSNRQRSTAVHLSANTVTKICPQLL